MSSKKNKRDTRVPALPGMDRRPYHLANDDCLNYLRRLPDASVDLALIDPPYEISRKTGFANVKNGVQRFAISMDFGSWDHNFPEMFDVVRELGRILRPGGTAISFYDIWKLSHLSEYFTNAGFKQLRLIEWLKTNPVPINSSRNYLTNAREIAVAAVKGGSPVFNSKYDNGVYQFPICHEKGRFHPTQKPLALIAALVEKHSSVGDVVLDCFAGSGTTAVAALQAKRRFVGCELDTSYWERAIERIEGALTETASPLKPQRGRAKASTAHARTRNLSTEVRAHG